MHGFWRLLIFSFVGRRKGGILCGLLVFGDPEFTVYTHFFLVPKWIHTNHSFMSTR